MTASRSRSVAQRRRAEGRVGHVREGGAVGHGLRSRGRMVPGGPGGRYKRVRSRTPHAGKGGPARGQQGSGVGRPRLRGGWSRRTPSGATTLPHATADDRRKAQARSCATVPRRAQSPARPTPAAHKEEAWTEPVPEDPGPQPRSPQAHTRDRSSETYAGTGNGPDGQGKPGNNVRPPGWRRARGRFRKRDRTLLDGWRKPSVPQADLYGWATGRGSIRPTKGRQDGTTDGAPRSGRARRQAVYAAWTFRFAIMHRP